MRSAQNVGRIVGLLLIVHLAAALTTPFILLEQANVRPANFLAGAAANEGTVRSAVLILFLGGALSMAIAIVAMPVFRR